LNLELFRFKREDSRNTQTDREYEQIRNLGEFFSFWKAKSLIQSFGHFFRDLLLYNKSVDKIEQFLNALTFYWGGFCA